MIFVPGGTFRMGSDRHYPEEAPVHRVTVDGFWIDRTPVTNRAVPEFVNATGYVTFAEIAPDPKDYPGALPHMLKAGSLVFSPPHAPVDLRDWTQWWSFKFGANWRRPYGPRSPSSGLDDHPVVHVAYRDARGLRDVGRQGLADRSRMGIRRARRARRRRVCLGRRVHARRQAHGQHLAGRISRTKTCRSDGFERTSPVTAFPPNGYGLHDMIGNVWEWTSDWYSAKHEADAPKACCIPENPRGGPQAASYDPAMPNIKIPRKVIKGGSHLCAPNYCRRYRPAARHAEPIDTSTSHVGFRCIRRNQQRENTA